ncbi:hypothetical protein [Hymenobacter pini]|uniref:hypothetical protein n=1 Tax=Hymenobacter pini TaxID=2880879 RepID=UPI001CF34EBD|nr:hypothetical protein [Hymenobacter pini]MCA8830214.1 hypothetical protein [Hymenobacter pini]
MHRSATHEANALRYITAMCPDCFPTGISQFSSWWAYEAFEQQLLRKPLKLLPGEVTRNRYTCAVCGEVWVLSEPDNAWRGYFLPEQEAEKAERRRTFSIWRLIGP